MPITLRVRELRQRAGLTQAELAAQAGVRRATICQMESPDVVGFHFHTLVSVGHALGLKNPIQLLEYRRR